MRGGRNKFGPMYKRDRARKLQVMRNRTVVPTVSLHGLNIYPGGNSNNPSSSSLGGNGNQQTMYTPQLHIKQEIQIPQVTSMTSSPDSSPSPVQLPYGLTMSATGNSNSGGGLSTQGGQIIAQQTDPSTGGIQWQISTSPNSGSRVRIIYCILLKFIYSEKATEFFEIFPLLLTVCTVFKSKGKISQNILAFSEYMNFINHPDLHWDTSSFECNYSRDS